jgi:hypothetical protein
MDTGLITIGLKTDVKVGVITTNAKELLTYAKEKKQ